MAADGRQPDEGLVRRRPAIFRALGRGDAPPRVRIGGEAFDLVEPFKHDSWAATALYGRGDERVVCKFNRQSSIFGVPMRWVGRLLARREARLLTLLSDLPNLPRLRAHVTDLDGRAMPHAVAHDYIAGHPLGFGERVGDGFFPSLAAAFEAMHGRGIAYVDLHKRENIIVGDDGRAYLVDFQICYVSPAGRVGRCWPLSAVFRGLVRSDRYHLLKHTIRHRPDLVGPAERDIDAHRPPLNRFIRAVGDRLRGVRRRLLVKLRVRHGAGLPSTEVEPEHAVRRERGPGPAARP